MCYSQSVGVYVCVCARNSCMQAKSVCPCQQLWQTVTSFVEGEEVTCTLDCSPQIQASANFQKDTKRKWIFPAPIDWILFHWIECSGFSFQVLSNRSQKNRHSYCFRENLETPITFMMVFIYSTGWIKMLQSELRSFCAFEFQTHYASYCTGSGTALGPAVKHSKWHLKWAQAHIILKPGRPIL